MIPRTVTTGGGGWTPVVVVQFPDLWGRNVSPFGLKLEAWLRLADIPYTVEPSTDLGKAPKGKLPYIRDDGPADRRHHADHRVPQEPPGASIRMPAWTSASAPKR